MSGPHISSRYESSRSTDPLPILFFCQDNQAAGESVLLLCYYLLNKEYPPKGNAHLSYSRAQRLKNQLYNFARTSFEAYYINNHRKPSFRSTVEAEKQCVTESGVREVWRELHIERRVTNELLQPEEVRLMHHRMSEADAPQNKVSLNDGEPKTINKLSSFIPISEDAEECNDRAIKRLKRQLREATNSAASAGWKITIHAGGLSPGIVETEKIFLSIGENANGQSWADFDGDCEEHVSKLYEKFLASAFSLDTRDAFQEKMAEFLPPRTKKAAVSRGNRDFIVGDIGPNETEESEKRGDYKDEENMANSDSLEKNHTNVKTSSTGIASLSGILQPRVPLSDFTLESDAALHADNIDAEIIPCDSGLNINIPNSSSFQPYSGDVTDVWALPNQTWNYSSMDHNYMESANSPPLPPPNTQNFDINAALDELFPPEWLQQFPSRKIEQLVSQLSASPSPNNQSTLQPNPLLNLFLNPSMLQQSSPLNSSLWPPNTSTYIVPQPFVPRSTPHQLYSPAAASGVVPHAPPFETDEGERIDAGRDEVTGGGDVTKEVGVGIDKGKRRQGGICSTVLVNGIGRGPRQLRASSNQDEGRGGDLLSDDAAIDADATTEADKLLKEAMWLKNSLSLLRSFDLGKDYRDCVSKWYELEVSLPFRTEGRMATLSRPTLLTKQLGKRLRATLPVLSELQQHTLITETMAWWNALQIKMRQSKDICGLPFADYTGDMSQINKKGRRGMFQFIYFILWWGTLVQESQLDVAKWRAFTIDVTACCEAMLKGRKLLEVAAKKRLTVECKGGAKRARTT
ncbi:hypothetical protein EDD85DRAFT_955692 [Armillaria nabsnona]|nr:hypothetical protein EDD85DRAFT_955692 [Armillaria nabsnona]